MPLWPTSVICLVILPLKQPVCSQYGIFWAAFALLGNEEVHGKVQDDGGVLGKALDEPHRECGTDLQGRAGIPGHKPQKGDKQAGTKNNP